MFMVRAKSRAACQAELQRLCERMNVQVVTQPTDAGGRDWVARAAPAQTRAPAGESGRGPVVSG